jgi:hypothetical protein
MKIPQRMKGGNKMKLAKTIVLVLIVMLLTSGVFAVSNTDSKGKSDDSSSKKALHSTSWTATKDPSKSNSYTEISNSETSSVNKVSISLDPRKQTSTNGEAAYKVIVKSLYLPDTGVLEAKEYKLSFEPEDQETTGEFGTQSVTLRPGEKISVDLNVHVENSGEHQFVVKAIDGQGNSAKSEGLLTVLDSNTEPSQKIKLDLQPEKQYTDTGNSESYTVEVYRPVETACYSNEECAASYSAQEYELVFVSEQESLTGEFQSSNPISLKPGERISVPLDITAKEKGTYVFKVYAKTSDYETSVKGLLVYGKEPQNTAQPSVTSTPSSSYVSGEGYAINEDQSEGILVYLNLLGEKELRGKMVFGKDTYALKGQVSDSGNEIEFNFYNPDDGGFDRSIGQFSGEVQKFDDFAILKGGIDFETSSYPNQYWTLTIVGKQNKVFENEIVVITPDTPVTKTINKEEVVTIRQGQPRTKTDSSDVLSSEQVDMQEAYIVPEKIETKKIFGFIPNPWGDKLLKVKLVDGEKIIEEKVQEFGTNIMGDYEVSIGSLENEDAIEVSITKSTKLRLN